MYTRRADGKPEVHWNEGTAIDWTEVVKRDLTVNRHHCPDRGPYWRCEVGGLYATVAATRRCWPGANRVLTIMRRKQKGYDYLVMLPTAPLQRLGKEEAA